jgi:hypothetical protein
MIRTKYIGSGIEVNENCRVDFRPSFGSDGFLWGINTYDATYAARLSFNDKLTREEAIRICGFFAGCYKELQQMEQDNEPNS